jgi:hypothetical protein
MSNKSQNNVNSMILNLESLIKQYDTLLIQYNQVQSDYINYLQRNPHSTLDNGTNNSHLITSKNNAFWGTAGISSRRVSNVEQCSALCSTTPGCSGATYNITNNSNQNNCWLRSGEGMVIAGTSDQYAIIPESKNYLLTLQTLNSQLMDINNKILIIFRNNENISSTLDKERFKKYNLLKQNYGKLEEERVNILNKLMDHQTIEEKKTQSELIVTKNYYNYVLLLFIVLLCFLILSKTIINSVNQDGQTTNSSFESIILVILISIILILFFTYFYKTFR